MCRKEAAVVAHITIVHLTWLHTSVEPSKMHYSYVGL